MEFLRPTACMQKAMRYLGSGSGRLCTHQSSDGTFVRRRPADWIQRRLARHRQPSYWRRCSGLKRRPRVDRFPAPPRPWSQMRRIRCAVLLLSFKHEAISPTFRFEHLQESRVNCLVGVCLCEFTKPPAHETKQEGSNAQHHADGAVHGVVGTTHLDALPARSQRPGDHRSRFSTLCVRGFLGRHEGRQSTFKH